MASKHVDIVCCASKWGPMHCCTAWRDNASATLPDKMSVNTSLHVSPPICGQPAEQAKERHDALKRSEWHYDSQVHEDANLPALLKLVPDKVATSVSISGLVMPLTRAVMQTQCSTNLRPKIALRDAASASCACVTMFCKRSRVRSRFPTVVMREFLHGSRTVCVPPPPPPPLTKFQALCQLAKTPYGSKWIGKPIC